MEAKGVPVKILVVPVFRRFWCFHAIEDANAAQKVAHEAESIVWTKGRNLEEKLALLGTKISSIVSALCLLAMSVHEGLQTKRLICHK